MSITRIPRPIGTATIEHCVHCSEAHRDFIVFDRGDNDPYVICRRTVRNTPATGCDIAPLPEGFEILEWVPQQSMIGAMADAQCVIGAQRTTIKRLDKKIADLSAAPAAGHAHDAAPAGEDDVLYSVLWAFVESHASAYHDRVEPLFDSATTSDFLAALKEKGLFVAASAASIGVPTADLTDEQLGPLLDGASEYLADLYPPFTDYDEKAMRLFISYARENGISIGLAATPSLVASGGGPNQSEYFVEPRELPDGSQLYGPYGSGKGVQGE